jgi:crossover junction endodeoxyribonuclease RuvC
MVFLGIDPGYGRLGWGVVEQTGSRLKMLDYGVLETEAGSPIEDRLKQVYDTVRQIVRRYKPVEAGVELLYFSKNVNTAMGVAQARGVILLALRQSNVPVVDISPQHVKLTVTGQGNAKKPQVQAMVQRLLNLREKPSPDDAADGLALAMAVIRTRGTRRLEAMVEKKKPVKKKRTRKKP